MTGGTGSLRALLARAAATCGALVVAALVLARLAGGMDHLGALALRCLGTPVAVILDTTVHIGTLATIGAVSFVLASMVRVAARQWINGRTIGQAVSRARIVSLPTALVDAAATAGVKGSVDAVEARRPFAFVYGWLRPRICVSTGLVERVSARELEAVLLHERWHTMRRDPLRLTAAAAVQSGLGKMPAFGSTLDRYAAEVEVAADRFVVAEMGHARWLARALLRVEASPSAPGFAGRTEPRIAALVENKDLPPERGRVRWPAAAIAAEATATALLVSDSRLTTPVSYVLLHAC